MLINWDVSLSLDLFLGVSFWPRRKIDFVGNLQIMTLLIFPDSALLLHSAVSSIVGGAFRIEYAWELALLILFNNFRSGEREIF